MNVSSHEFMQSWLHEIYLKYIFWLLAQFLTFCYFKKTPGSGVPFMAQQLTNLTRIHEDTGSNPGLTQQTKDPVLPWAVV